MMNRATFKDVVEPVMNKIFDGVYEQLPTEYTEYMTVETALKRSFEEEPVLAGFQTASEKSEGAGVAYAEGGQVYVARYTAKTIALAFAMSEELIEDGEHMSLGSRYAKHLGFAMHEAKEVTCANILNRATTAGYEGGDGVTLGSASHPSFQGGVQSNILANPAQLSEASLEQMLIKIRKAKNFQNQPIALRAKKLIVAPENQFEAERILASTHRVGTSDNDANAIRSMGLLPEGACVVTRITNPNFWGTTTTASEGLKLKVRSKIKRAMEGDFNTGNMRYKARERYAAGVTDWHGFYLTDGVSQ